MLTNFIRDISVKHLEISTGNCEQHAFVKICNLSNLKIFGNNWSHIYLNIFKCRNEWRLQYEQFLSLDAIPAEIVFIHSCIYKSLLMYAIEKSKFLFCSGLECNIEWSAFLIVTYWSILELLQTTVILNVWQENMDFRMCLLWNVHTLKLRTWQEHKILAYIKSVRYIQYIIHNLLYSTLCISCFIIIYMTNMTKYNDGNYA